MSFSTILPASMVQQGNNQLLAIAGLLVAILAASVSKTTRSAPPP